MYKFLKKENKNLIVSICNYQMRAFSKASSMSAKERTERKRNQTLYNSLRQTPSDNRTYQVKQSETGETIVISSGYQEKYNMIRGREHYLQTQGTDQQKQKVYGRVLRTDQPFLSSSLDDYRYRTFDADRINRVDATYPGQELDDEENYIYNLPIHLYYDNADNDDFTDNPGEMNQKTYDVYNYFLSYPYSLDPSGQIDYGMLTSQPTVDKFFVVLDASNVYQQPKSLIREPLKLDIS